MAVCVKHAMVVEDVRGKYESVEDALEVAARVVFGICCCRHGTWGSSRLNEDTQVLPVWLFVR